ncbi:MAG: hypothetical protein HOQ03_04635, partial [Thermoleophilia bacterium]|nr:hypothetical protein [Thermoleophilia bacterium]
RALFPLLALVAATSAAAVYLLAPAAPVEPARAVAPARTTPTAREFAHSFVGTTNAFAQADGDATRIRNAQCVEANRGHYMCSYAAKRPGIAPECYVMQARWTPRADSTITVTLAGRAGRCGTLREALRSLA